MANRPERASAKKRGRLRSVASGPVAAPPAASSAAASRPTVAPRPQNENVVRALPSRKEAFERVFTELKALGGRGGEALGEAYALAASSVLHASERLEDFNAERRFRARVRSHSGAAARAPASGRTLSADELSTSK